MSADEFISKKLLIAIGHPLRIAILEVLFTETSSPKLISKRLRRGISEVSYHTRVLAENHCIDLLRTEPRRGAEEHFYCANPQSFIGHQDWRNLPDGLVAGVSTANLHAFLDRVADAIEAHSREGAPATRPGTVMHWATIQVDQTGWSKASAILEESRGQLEGIHAECVRRLKLSRADGTPMVIGIAGFEAAPT